ncbi:MAG: CRISPR-associated endonuclease Cas2 [Nitrososphaerota archaeon]
MYNQISHLLVIYDVSEDERRIKLADSLKLLGFTRVQKSAFLSEYKPALVSEVKRKSLRIIDITTDNVQIYPLTPASYSLRTTIGKLQMGQSIKDGDGFYVI